MGHIRKFPHYLFVNKTIFMLIYHRDVILYHAKIYLARKTTRPVFFYLPWKRCEINCSELLSLSRKGVYHCLSQAHQEIVLIDNMNFIHRKSKMRKSQWVK